MARGCRGSCTTPGWQGQEGSRSEGLHAWLQGARSQTASQPPSCWKRLSQPGGARCLRARKIFFGPAIHDRGDKATEH